RREVLSDGDGGYQLVRGERHFHLDPLAGEPVDDHPLRTARRDGEGAEEHRLQLIAAHFPDSHRRRLLLVAEAADGDHQLDHGIAGHLKDARGPHSSHFLTPPVALARARRPPPGRGRALLQVRSGPGIPSRLRAAPRPFGRAPPAAVERVDRPLLHTAHRRSPLSPHLAGPSRLSNRNQRLAALCYAGKPPAVTARLLPA